MVTMEEAYNQLIDQIITSAKAGIAELIDATSPFSEPRIVKHDIAERAVVGDFFAIISAGPVEVLRHKTATLTDHIFNILVDLTFYSDDFKLGQENNLKVSGKFYDLFHNTTLNNLCRQVDVEIFPVPSGQIENFYAITSRIVIKCEKTLQK